MTQRAQAFVALPGGASHASTIAGALLELDTFVDIIGLAGVSAGFLDAGLAAFGVIDKLPALLEEMLQENRVLDPVPDGRIGLCRWEVIPRLVDKVLGEDARLGDALVPLVGVVTTADRREPLYLSSWATPNVLVRDAARATSAIFPLAPMVRIPSLGTTLSPDIGLYFDGGFTDNRPDHVFDNRPQRTISVNLRQDREVQRVRDGDHLAQALAVAGSITFAQCASKSRRRDLVVVDIDAVGSGLDFSLSPAEISARINRGRQGVRAAQSLAPFRP